MDETPFKKAYFVNTYNYEKYKLKGHYSLCKSVIHLN